MAIKSLSKVDRQNVTVQRVFAHRFRSATIPKTFDFPLRVPLAVPFSDVSTNMGSAANYPHPARVAGYGPLTLVDADRTATLSSADVEIISIDQDPFNVDGTSTSAASVT